MGNLSSMNVSVLARIGRSFLILLSGAIVLSGLPVVSLVAQTKSPKKLVVTMDSNQSFLVYDPENPALKRANTDEISDALNTIKGLAVVKETTSLAWRREAQVKAMNPDLVIMHWSAFTSNSPTPETERDSNKKFISFLQYMSGSKVQFLIYTQALSSEAFDRARIAAWEQKAPKLTGRIQLFTFPQKPGRFRDPKTKQALRTQVRNMLRLN